MWWKIGPNWDVNANTVESVFWIFYCSSRNLKIYGAIVMALKHQFDRKFTWKFYCENKLTDCQLNISQFKENPINFRPIQYPGDNTIILVHRIHIKINYILRSSYLDKKIIRTSLHRWRANANMILIQHYRTEILSINIQKNNKVRALWYISNVRGFLLLAYMGDSRRIFFYQGCHGFIIMDEPTRNRQRKCGQKKNNTEPKHKQEYTKKSKHFTFAYHTNVCMGKIRNLSPVCMWKFSYLININVLFLFNAF